MISIWSFFLSSFSLHVQRVHLVHCIATKAFKRLASDDHATEDLPKRALPATLLFYSSHRGIFFSFVYKSIPKLALRDPNRRWEKKKVTDSSALNMHAYNLCLGWCHFHELPCGNVIGCSLRCDADRRLFMLPCTQNHVNLCISFYQIVIYCFILNAPTCLQHVLSLLTFALRSVAWNSIFLSIEKWTPHKMIIREFIAFGCRIRSAYVRFCQESQCVRVHLQFVARIPNRPWANTKQLKLWCFFFVCGLDFCFIVVFRALKITIHFAKNERSGKKQSWGKIHTTNTQ